MVFVITLLQREREKEGVIVNMQRFLSASIQRPVFTIYRKNYSCLVGTKRIKVVKMQKVYFSQLRFKACIKIVIFFFCFYSFSFLIAVIIFFIMSCLTNYLVSLLNDLDSRMLFVTFPW